MLIQGICLLSVVPMRAEPSDRSEMTNQVLFGEVFTILESQEKWSKVRLLHDGYEGWLCNKQWSEIDNNLLKSCEIVIGKNGKAKWSNQSLILPLGARLWNLKKETAGWKGSKMKVKAESAELITKTKEKKLLKSAQSLLGTPYLWGGRTTGGIDCSGFVQIVYATNGCQLPRDASEQALLGVEINLADSETGDLAFFGNEEGKVTHVGIISSKKNGKKKIYHASGKVRLDYIDEKGIFTEDIEEKRYTHTLLFVKRVLK